MDINDLVQNTLNAIKAFKEQTLEHHILMHWVQITESEVTPGKILGAKAVLFLNRSYIYTEFYLKGLKLMLNAYDYSITTSKSRIKVTFFIPLV